MATQLDASTFTNYDKNLARLSAILKQVVTEVLHFIFEIGSNDRPQHLPLQEYYRSKGVEGFNKGLSSEQKKRIKVDPTGATYDITLLYKCLRDGYHGLAGKDDDQWKKKDGSSIESLIGIIKDKRNMLAHEQPSLTIKQLIEEGTQLKDVLIEIIGWCGKLYNLPDTVTDPKFVEVEDNIKKYMYDDCEPKTFEEYKNELFFEAQSEHVNTEGVKELQEQYEKRCEDRVSTVNHYVDINLPIDNIYTEMKLISGTASHQNNSTTFEQVLLDSGQNKTGDIVVKSGVAGVGKTTFTKKILHDWKSGQSIMKHLTDHDILLKAECRNKAVNTFDELLHSLMPKVSRDFKFSDLRKVILAQNVLVIIDGLDELNRYSAHLFEEILDLRKSYNISILITTRPEKLNYLEKIIKSHQLSMKHIQLLGVPMEKRAELVTKYYDEIAKTHPGIQDIGGLLAYLEKTKFRLDELWKLPYNLTLITMLWAYDYMNVAKINTAPEMYREVLELCKTKLMQRLRSSEAAHHLPESRLKSNVDIFLKCLARESLIGLKENHINLPKEAYERLEKVCGYINIPVEEMTSAFLKRLPGDEDIYSFPHKGLQDYLAALYIWLEVTNESERIDTRKVIDDIEIVLNQNDIEFNVAQDILKLTKQRLEAKSSTVGLISWVGGHLLKYRKASSIINKVMQEIHQSMEYDISKFQNMFIYLIGIFYLDSNNIQERTKLEALKLLQKSGVQIKEDWIAVLNSVKCDDYVASFISRQPRILGDNIEISDSSLSAYVSLMQALKPPLENANKVKVDIEINDEPSDSVLKLFQIINSHQFRVRKFLVNDNNFKTYMALLENFTIPLVDAGSVMVEIDVNEDLHSMAKLLELIEGKGITIAALKVQDINISDTNFHDIVSTIKSMPCFPKDANLTGINIDMTKGLFDVEELREMMMSYNFRIKRFLVNENNYEKYTQMLKGLNAPLKDTQTIAMEIVIDRDIRSVTEFLEQVKGKNISVKKFKLRDLYLYDDRAEEYRNALKLMSPQWREVNTTAVDLFLYVKMNLESIWQLLAEHGFKVKTIYITDKNVRHYPTVLESLETPLKDAQEIVVDIKIDLDLLEIEELLSHIKDKNFQIGNLKLKSEYIRIDDTNVHEYAKVLQSMPTFVSDNCKVTVVLELNMEYPVTATILEEISKHQFTVKIYLSYGFKEPILYSYTSPEDCFSLNMVFERCHVLTYKGLILPEMKIPLSLQSLVAKIPDTSSYLRFREYIDTKNRSDLRDLHINISLTVNMEDIVPLPNELSIPPSLTIIEIATDSDIFVASKIAKKLAPVAGMCKGKFTILRIERCKLEPKEIIKFLEELRELFITTLISFPIQCRPVADDEQTQMQELAKTFCPMGVHWVNYDKNKISRDRQRPIDQNLSEKYGAKSKGDFGKKVKMVKGQPKQFKVFKK